MRVTRAWRSKCEAADNGTKAGNLESYTSGRCRIHYEQGECHFGPRNCESGWFPSPSFFSNDPRRRPYPKEVWSKYPVEYDPFDRTGSHRNKGDSQNCPCSLGETSHSHISYGISWRVLACLGVSWRICHVLRVTLCVYGHFAKASKIEGLSPPRQGGHAADPSESKKWSRKRTCGIKVSPHSPHFMSVLFH